MTIIKLILSLIKWIIIIGIAVLGVYVISSNFNILGNYRPYLVQSGSMEPSIMTGDIVVIQSRNTYVINDVITFKKIVVRLLHIVSFLLKVKKKNNILPKEMPTVLEMRI